MSLKYEVVRTELRMRYLRHGLVHKDHGYAIIWNDGEMHKCRYGFGVWCKVEYYIGS